MPWSDDARVLARPFSAYAELAIAEDERRGTMGGDPPYPPARPVRTALSRALFFLFVSAAFVSLVTAGRFVAFHLVSTMAFWSFIPAVQALAFVVALRAVAPKAPRAESLSLYFAGHGAWMIFFLAVSAMCLFAPDVRVAFGWLLQKGVLPLALVVTVAWSVVITYACFRAGVGLPWRRAAAGTGIFYGAFTVVIVGYYLAMNEIQPQLPWAP